MSTSQFRKPLVQSALVLLAFLVCILFVNGAQPTGFFGSIGAVFVGTFKTILYIIGLTLGVLFCIAVLVAIFFGAVALYSPELSSKLYISFKESLVVFITELQDLLTCNCECSTSKRPTIDTEELNTLNNKLIQTERDRDASISTINDLTVLADENKALVQSLKHQLEEAEVAKTTLQQQNDEDTEAHSVVTSELDTLKASIATLESDKESLSKQVSQLTAKVEELENAAEMAPEAGIFSYFEADEDKELFVDMIEKAIKQEMTYAQIDVFLTEELPEGVDKIVKEHPSLTKNYIRNLRR